MCSRLAFPAVPLPRPADKQQARYYQQPYLVSLFNGMASSYEGMNYLTSFGFSYVWRRQFLQPLPSLQGAVKVADLMTGMGEM